MKILQTGDLHLGKLQYGRFERTIDFADVLDRIVDIAVKEEVDLVVLAGDIFDSYFPDAFSQKAFRLFVDKLKKKRYTSKEIEVIAIEGNHDFDKRNSGERLVTRIDSITSQLTRPADLINNPYRLGAKIIALDWMPSAKLKIELEKIEEKVDILILHQSCEGLAPEVSTPEVTISQLQGKANLVLIGDIHIVKRIQCEQGTLISSAGSTELCSSSEAVQKSVTIIEYDAETKESVIRTVGLKTRPVLSYEIKTEEDLKDVNDKLTHMIYSNPLIFISFASSIKSLFLQKHKQWIESGLSLIIESQIQEVSLSETFYVTKEDSKIELEKIIENNISDKDEQLAAISMWKNPQATKQIVAELKNQIKAKWKQSTV